MSEQEATDFVSKLAKNKSIDWDGANKRMSIFRDEYLQNLTAKDFIEIQNMLKPIIWISILKQIMVILV